MIYTSIRCDKCGLTMQTPGVTPKWLMERLFRDKGWTCGKQHLCPTCRRKRKDG